jgi:hypothetical protein
LAVVIALPPYALAPLAFRFRALVALAERLPMGGERELAVAMLVAARVLWDWRGQDAFPQEATASRAQAARQWLQTLSLPVGTRAVFHQVLDAVGSDSQRAALDAWERLLTAMPRGIEGASRAEFRELGQRLRSTPADLPTAAAS